MPEQTYGTVNVPSELALVSGKQYGDPFNQVDLDVVFTGPEGTEYRVPAFWAGGQEWRVRFAAPGPGEYTWRSLCTDEQNASLHNRQGVFLVEPYEGSNPLLLHGPLTVSESKRHLEHRDGVPFFWLGDTWWMAFSKRIGWPDELRMLTADRVEKGFSVIQLVAGLFPDMHPLNERGGNDAGLAWEDDFIRVNPAFFDLADLRIQWLVRSGLVPCIVGCWGYYLPVMGIEKMKKHWRYLVARYGAYPVVWCLAGEGAMPFYLSEDREKDVAVQKEGWTEVGHFVREVDPFHRLVTIHPTQVGRDQVVDDSVLDFDMLQTGHSGFDSIPNTVEIVRAEMARKPRMPVVQGEVCYEGILGGSWQDIQRFMFWSCMLSGTCGYTYGANGIWQFNRTEEPFGPSPGGGTWGDTPWQEAYQYPGSRQVGAGRRVLERFEWWRFEPHQEWVEPHADKKEYRAPFAAGIPGELRVILLPRGIAGWTSPVRVKKLEKGVQYAASFIDAGDGREVPIGDLPDAKDWQIPITPTREDWLLVLTKR